MRRSVHVEAAEILVVLGKFVARLLQRVHDHLRPHVAEEQVLAVPDLPALVLGDPAAIDAAVAKLRPEPRIVRRAGEGRPREQRGEEDVPQILTAGLSV